jgi:hypothetical protein
VEPALAIRTVADRLPALDPMAREALALVELSGRTRAEAAARLEVPGDELAAALAKGRKELRRSLEAMAASGWCERAELLISDRLDGELDEIGAARLDVHLRNCPRCVEHERRLVQALDGLAEGVAAGEAAPDPLPGAAPTPALAPVTPLRLAEPGAEEGEVREPGSPAPSLGRPPIASRPFGAPVGPAKARPRHHITPPEPSVELRSSTDESEETSETGPPRAVLKPQAPEAALPERVAAAALEPARRSAREVVVAGTWHLMFAVALLLAVATIAITVWGALGGEL